VVGWRGERGVWQVGAPAHQVVGQAPAADGRAAYARRQGTLLSRSRCADRMRAQLKSGVVRVPLCKIATWWSIADDVALLEGLVKCVLCVIERVRAHVCVSVCDLVRAQTRHARRRAGRARLGAAVPAPRQCARADGPRSGARRACVCTECTHTSALRQEFLNATLPALRAARRMEIAWPPKLTTGLPDAAVLQAHATWLIDACKKARDGACVCVRACDRHHHAATRVRRPRRDVSSRSCVRVDVARGARCLPRPAGARRARLCCAGVRVCV
jgi:hypothetical protein